MVNATQQAAVCLKDTFFDTTMCRYAAVLLASQQTHWCRRAEFTSSFRTNMHPLLPIIAIGSKVTLHRCNSFWQLLCLLQLLGLPSALLTLLRAVVAEQS